MAQHLAFGADTGLIKPENTLHFNVEITGQFGDLSDLLDLTYRRSYAGCGYASIAEAIISRIARSGSSTPLIKIIESNRVITSLVELACKVVIEPS